MYMGNIGVLHPNAYITDWACEHDFGSTAFLPASCAIACPWSQMPPRKRCDLPLSPGQQTLFAKPRVTHGKSVGSTHRPAIPPEQMAEPMTDSCPAEPHASVLPPPMVASGLPELPATGTPAATSATVSGPHQAIVSTAPPDHASTVASDTSELPAVVDLPTAVPMDAEAADRFGWLCG